jgi:transcription initiation factor TFIID subunit 6
VKHVVSRELILFFDKIREAILDESPDQDVVILRKSAFESIRSDPGLHQLVPYFVQFVSEKVTHSLGNLFVLRQMMELTQAMIENKSLFVEPYVASLVPPILTCILGRNIGAEGSEGLQDQYELRDLAVSLIGHISQKFSTSNGELQARLARTCLKYFLDPSRSLGEHYGAISGITAIGGPNAITTLVLPSLKTYEYILVKAQNERGSSDPGVQMLIAAIIKAVTTITGGSTATTNGINGTNGHTADAQQVEEYLGSIIGSRIAGLGNHDLNQAILESRGK